MYTVMVGHFPFHFSFFDDKPGENYVGHKSMDRMHWRLMHAQIDWSSSFWKVNPLAFDFVRKSLSADSSQRLTILEAVEHPFILS